MNMTMYQMTQQVCNFNVTVDLFTPFSHYCNIYPGAIASIGTTPETVGYTMFVSRKKLRQKDKEVSWKRI